MPQMEGLISAFVIPLMMASLVPWLLFLYFGFRYRAMHEGQWDRYLGLKAVGHAFFSLGVLLLLGSITAIVVEFVVEGTAQDRGDGLSPTLRASFALLVSSVVLCASASYCMSQLTNDDDYPMVRRFFLGARFGFSGVVAFGALTATLMTLFARGEIGDPFSVAASVLLVWTGSSVVHLRLLISAVNQSNVPASDIPESKSE